MNERKDGGPAFGGAYDEVYVSEGHPEVTAKIERRVPGMSLRDYLAAKAMLGLMGRAWANDNGQLPVDVFDIWATSAYKLADAMLAARSK